jgi:hypothetical protein
LVDIVVSAGLGTSASGDKCGQLKARLFRAILKAERPFLGSVPDIVADIEREIEARFGRETELNKRGMQSEAAD